MPKLLNQTQEQEIVRSIDRGMSKAEAARRFDISPRTVGRILERQTRSAKVEVPDTDEGWVDTTDHREPKREYTYVASSTQMSITVLEDGKPYDTVMVDNNHPKFNDALGMIALSIQNGGDQTAIADAYRLISMKEAINAVTFGRATIDPANEMVYYTTEDGRKVSFAGKLFEKLLQGAKKGDQFVTEGLIKFADYLSQNPSNRMLTRLYDFIAAKDIEIDEDGMVVCFKKVRSDYKDCHSGTFDNSPGKVVMVERNEVDENESNTCSNGLHVAAQSYLPSYFGAKIVKVRFNPKDAVSCPPDYNDAKLRVCRYEVLEDVTNELQHLL